jgi:hypothetical protein
MTTIFCGGLVKECLRSRPEENRETGENPVR